MFHKSISWTYMSILFISPWLQNRAVLQKRIIPIRRARAPWANYFHPIYPLALLSIWWTNEVFSNRLGVHLGTNGHARSLGSLLSRGSASVDFRQLDETYPPNLTTRKNLHNYAIQRMYRDVWLSRSGLWI